MFLPPFSPQLPVSVFESVIDIINGEVIPITSIMPVLCLGIFGVLGIGHNVGLV